MSSASSPADKFAILSRRVVTADDIRPAAILVEGGVISTIIGLDDVPSGLSSHDFGDLVVMSGLVDSHVHVNEPGRTEWEGFVTATKAAAAGGITTIADMPLNSIPVTTTLPAFNEKIKSLVDTTGLSKLSVDCAFFGGVVPGNAASIEPMIEAGVAGFKCFLIHSGIDDFPNVTEADLHAVLPLLARHQIPLLVHAELEHEHAHAHEPSPNRVVDDNPWHDSRSYKQFLQSRPRAWENDAIRLMLRLCAQYKCPVHIVHLSSADLIGDIQEAIATGLPFTVETCPHYLTFAAEEIPDGDTRFKCAPPIRERENREKLWAALQTGTIGIVVSDHSPCAPDLKFLGAGDLKKAWGGISSLQFRLPAVWTEAQKRGAGIETLALWLCENPAKFLGLGDRKGRIETGYDADFVIWDPQAPAIFDPSNIEHRHKVTPYEGRELIGKIHATYLRGKIIWADGKHVGSKSGKKS